MRRNTKSAMKKTGSIKQVIVLRKDVKMSKGKSAAQCCHASVESCRTAGSETGKMWEKTGQKKVILYASGLSQLMELKQKADNAGLPNALIRDAGLTEVSSGTVTCLGIGPADSKKIDKITGSLPLVK